jgi:hypothetical protein
MIIKKKYFNQAVIISCITFIFTGCIKKDPESSVAQVLLTPLSPNAGRVDLSINGVLYQTGVDYSNSTTAGTIRYTLPYYNIEPKAGTSISYNLNGRPTAYASVNKDVLEDNVYSTFLIDSASKAKIVVVNDNLTDPTPGKVKIRFFNFSPNSPVLDVVIQGSTGKLFTNRGYNDQTTVTANENFIEIDPGTYTFLFNNAVSGANAYTTSAQTLLPDRIYTLIARGFVGGAGVQALGALVHPNKP